MLETKADFPQETEQRKSTHRVPRFIGHSLEIVISGSYGSSVRINVLCERHVIYVGTNK